MRILFDGTPCTFSADTIGEAVAQGTEHANSAGRVIIEISVDGQTLDIEDGIQEDAVAEEISFTSLTPDELLLATLELGERAIESAQENFNRAAQLIQSGDRAQAHLELKQGIDLWKTVEETVFREIIPEIPHQDKALGDRVSELRNSLDAIMTAIANNDVAALSDTLLYEFPRTSAGCASFLKQCSETVTQGILNDRESDA